MMKTDDEYLKELTEILTTVKSSSLANSLKFSHQELRAWLVNKTTSFSPKNIMESIYIVQHNIKLIPICKCGNKVKFMSITVGYQKYCSNRCCTISETRISLYKKTVSKFSDEKKETIRSKYITTMNYKYGTHIALNVTEIKEKKELTDTRRYGKPYYVGSNQQKQDSIEKYGVDSPNRAESKKEAFRQTCLEKFNFTSPLQSAEIRRKRLSTMITRFGVEYVLQRDDYRKHMQDILINNKKWSNPIHKPDWQVYKILSHFKGSIHTFINTDIDQELFEKYGMFNSWTNKTGVVRDHMFSRRHGFDFKVFPEIIRHPANCVLLFHKENSSKGCSSSISINELFNRTSNYKKEWHEQNVCLELIDKYLKGERWTRLSFKEE